MSATRSSLGGGPNHDAIELDVFSEVATAPAPIDKPVDAVDQPASSNHDEYPGGFKLLAITVGLVLSIFLSALDTTIIATAIPSITDEFGSIRNIAWYGSAYQVTNTAFQSAWGKAYRYFPLKTVFMLSIAVFEIGNVICAAAPSSATLILGRVVAGVGGGGVMTGAFIIIATTVKPRYRPAYMGVLGFTFAGASVLGPLMGGALTDGPGWRWCFWISLPVAAVAALTMFIFFTAPANPLGETPLKTKIAHTDPVGALLATGALSCFVMAMHWAGTLDWSSIQIKGSLAGFGTMTAAFLANEWFMGPKAMLQLHLFKKRSIVLNLAFSFFLAGMYFPLLFSLPVLFQSVNNDSAAQSGIRLIPLVLGVSIFTMLTNVVLTVWRHYNPLLVCSALVGTAGILLIYKAADASTSTGAWIGFESLTAAGVGIALQIPMIANQDAVSRDDIAGVTSLSLFMENLGTAIFVATSEATFTTGLVSSLQQNVPSVDPTVVIDAGVTQLRNVFVQPAELAGILRAYLDGCKVSHTVSVACGAATAVVSLVGAWPAGMRMLQTRLQKPHMP
ncbi:MFS gliotoxin efflux transporter glia [Thozetella sp. PMI_491]|nr:MFS gliotoxin efflux transporter glia [Thozetella sp. PMI_491]